jgi:hypothetical protein
MLFKFGRGAELNPSANGHENAGVVPHSVMSFIVALIASMGEFSHLK